MTTGLKIGLNFIWRRHKN